MLSSSRPKVVHVVVAGEIGGAERFLADLTSRPELSGADHCLALMTPNPGLRDFFNKAGLQIRDRGLVRENPLAYLWRSYGPADIAWLEQVLEEEKADLLHAHTYGSHVLAARAALRGGAPLLRTEHGVRHYRDPSCALNRHWALRATDRVIAISAFVAGFVAKAAPQMQGRIQVIHNGIDLARFQPVEPVTEGPFTFAVISRLEAVKRVALAVEAVALIPDVRLIVAGEGSQRPALEALVRKRGIGARVRFLGRLDDPRPVIASSDAVVNCTNEEGLGLAVIEAAAMQRAAVAYAGGGIPEIVQNRQTGWLVKEGSVAALAAALAEAAASRKQAAEFGRAARAWVEPRFGIDDMCKRYAVVYRDLVRERSLPPAEQA
jgi:glycosyltransferase involved in cell wall biosynthesis